MCNCIATLLLLLNAAHSIDGVETSLINSIPAVYTAAMGGMREIYEIYVSITL